MAISKCSIIFRYLAFLILFILINCTISSTFLTKNAFCLDLAHSLLKSDTEIDKYVILSVGGICAFYPLDIENKANDISINDNNGILFNAQYKTDRFGNENSCLEFQNTGESQDNPSASYITIPGDDKLQPENQITVSAAINARIWKPSAIIVKAFQQGDNASYSLFYNDNRIFFYLLSEDGEYVSVSTKPPSLQTWHHIAATWDGYYLKLYIDASKVDECQFSGKISYDNRPVYIGSHDPDGDNIPGWGWYGLIDDVAIFDRALDENEIRFINDPFNQDNKIFNISITEPENNSEFEYDDIIFFNSTATQTTQPYTFTWSSNIDGFLGEGKSITATNLSPGLHKIILIGEDGLKNTDSYEILIRIIKNDFSTKNYEITYGINDNFNNENTENSNPDPNLIKYVLNSGDTYTSSYDNNGSNEFFIESLSDLNKGEVICNASILFHIMPESDNCMDDTITLSSFENILNSQNEVLTINIADQINYEYNSNKSFDLLYSLSPLDNEQAKLLINIQKYGILDIIIGDNTSVDYIKLNLSLVAYSGSIKGSVGTSIVGYSTPVSGAHIKILETDQNASTDINGNFELINLKKGTYNIKVVSDYFEDKFIENIIVSSNQIELSTINLDNCKCTSIEEKYNEIIKKFDISIDNKIDLKEAINALKIVSKISK